MTVTEKDLDSKEKLVINITKNQKLQENEC